MNSNASAFHRSLCIAQSCKMPSAIQFSIQFDLEFECKLLLRNRKLAQRCIKLDCLMAASIMIVERRSAALYLHYYEHSRYIVCEN